MTYAELTTEITVTKNIMDMLLACAKDEDLPKEKRNQHYSDYLEQSTYYLQLSAQRKYMEAKEDVFSSAIVKETIAVIRIMWDCRGEKDFYHRVNWMVGMDETYREVLSMLFAQYAEGHETPSTFAQRIAGIK